MEIVDYGVGTVLLDVEGFAWQRRAGGWKHVDGGHRSEASQGIAFAEMTRDYGPMVGPMLLPAEDPR